MKKFELWDFILNNTFQIWFEVQRTWSHLESIFIGSEDIRKQLPEDSKRFDGIDSDFKELMEAAVKTPNVIEATCQPGLFAKLEDLQVRSGSLDLLNNCRKHFLVFNIGY